jgi:hypothetical protein
MPKNANSLWSKYFTRFKRTWIGVLILALAPALTFLSTFTGVFDWMEQRFFSRTDLIVSSLAQSDRLIRLPGFPVIGSDLNTPLFTGGFRARLSLAHNGEGSGSIKVTGIKVVVDEFKAETFAKYSYKINADQIIGRGVAEAKVFRVSLNGSSTEAIWVDEKEEPHIARSDNLLDIEPPKVLTLTGSSDIGEEMDITVMANKPGLYHVRFLFNYFVKGNDQKQYSLPIAVYYED